MSPVSYSQRFEDLYLALCFPEQATGFYVDIGAGHPVYDNVSFGFYLRGWRGIAAEPNPALAALGRAVRPRDLMVNALVGAAPGEATFHLVNEFHGLSTMIGSHAARAHSEFGKSSQAMTMPVTTLVALCEAHAPHSFEFLKIDVEGAEADVIRGADLSRFRPKVIVVEALAPYSLAPAWDDWEPMLTGHDYRYARFDSLNRYYVATEETDILRALTSAPDTFPDAILFRDAKPALASPGHPDHMLATLLADAAMTRLPLLDREIIVDLLVADLPADRPVGPADALTACERVYGSANAAQAAAELTLPAGATLRDLYRLIAATDRFRAACGRISASYAW